MAANKPNPWDERYDRSDYYYGTAPNDFLLSEVTRFPPGSHVLCLAEGEGRNAVFLAKSGCNVTAIDFSQVGLDKLSALAALNNVSVQTICADLSTYAIAPETWDGIVSIWCHLPSRVRADLHKGVVRGLKKNGIYLLEAYTPEQLKYRTGGPKDPDWMPTAPELSEELKELDVIQLTECIRTISEGPGHQGKSAVVQYIGIKPLRI
jgi:hypothetical protein